MEAITIKVELGLSQDLKAFICQSCDIIASVLSLGKAHEPISAAPAKEEAKQPDVAEAAPSQEEPKAEATETISDIQLMEVVKVAKGEGNKNTDAIKDIFASFGIKTSRECPQARRAALIEKLKELK